MTDNAFARIIDAAATDNGLDIRDTFNNLMIAKVQKDIEARKVEIAKQMFAGGFNTDGVDTVETPGDVAPEEEVETETEESPDVEVDLSDDEIEDFLNNIEDAEEGNKEDDKVTT